MKTVSLSGSLRENVGKKDAKKHRREGLVPCVLYGGKEQVHFYAEEKQFKKIMFTPEVFIIKLNIGEKEYNTIVQDIQFHPVTDRFLHVDFLEVVEGKPVIISIPVKLTGVSTGVLKGGKLILKMRKVKVRALMEHLPDYIEADITPLEIGDSIRINNVKRENLTFLDDPGNIIVGVRTARTVVEEVPVGEAVVEGAPVEGAPVEGAPAKGAPGKGVPAKGGEKKEGEKK